MATVNLLYASEYAINDHIKIMIPKVGEILDDESVYNNLVTILTASPVDLMAELDTIGIDFSEINDYELFLILFEELKNQDTKLVFGNLNLKNFQYDKNDNGVTILRDMTTGVVIDRAIYYQIAGFLRKIHNLEKNNRKPANIEAKEYMLKRAHEKLKRRRRQKVESRLESNIVSLVNTEQFKYDFEGTRELSIYKFNRSVRQIVNKIGYDNKMMGVYFGTVDVKKLSQDELSWFEHNK